MKQLTIFLVFIFSCTISFGQNGEFKIYSSGLMYSDTTMRQLEFIVDSLNIKFRTCDLSRAYCSKFQARAHYVILEKKNVKRARKDMANNMAFEDFIRNYPEAIIDRDLLVVKFKYKNYDEREIVSFTSIIEEHEIEIEEKPEFYSQAVIGKWVFDYWKRGRYNEESIRAFYFTTEFENRPLPEVYARMVQYSDCMVDTSTQIFRENAQRTGRYYNTEQTSSVNEFMNYMHRETNKPEYVEGNYEGFLEKFEEWDSLRLLLIDSDISNRGEFKVLLKDAIAEALVKGGSSDEFEEYVGRYFSKKEELELKRGRIVVGGCSMDNSPRVHAMNIAVLSAETVNWETFLRAHLDIMNDRFERASDGSYAWARRQTYIKELEELDINISDLLFGISFRLEDPSQNHYYGNIGRLGRALSESIYSSEIEASILEMIRDKHLDDYNRVIMYYLFRNYNYFIEDESRKKQNMENLIYAVQELPGYLARRIKAKE